MADDSNGGKAFGFTAPDLTGIATRMGSQITQSAFSAVDGAISRGIGELTSKIGQKLGVFGNGLTGANGWTSRATARPDPHFQIDWNIMLPDTGSWGDLNAYVEEVQAPVSDFQVSAGIFRGGTRQYYPEISDISPLTLTFYEDQKFSTSGYINAWKARIADANTGLYNYPSEFKRSIKVFATDVRGSVIAVFEYTGCWPSRVPQYQFASSQTGRTTLAVEFSVDNCTMTVGGAGAGFLGFGKIQDFINGLPANIGQSVAGGFGTMINNGLGKLF